MSSPRQRFARGCNRCAGLEELLLRAAASDIRRLAGSCQNMLDHCDALSTTVAHTARKQNRDVLTFLVDAMRARSEGSEPPSLFAGSLHAAAA